MFRFILYLQALTLDCSSCSKSDIATVCSGSVVEDIDIEMGSVASDGGKKPPPQHHQSKDDVKPKGVEFASNILNPLNDMGPPQESFMCFFEVFVIWPLHLTLSLPLIDCLCKPHALT